MWTWLATALAAPVGPLFEPAVETGAGTVEVSGQTYGTGPTWISGARFTATAQHDRMVFGFDARFLDDPFASDHWDVRAANLMLGYLVVDDRVLAVMPYVRGGSHLQAGVAMRVRARLSFATLLVDMSFGPVMDLPETFTTTGPSLGAYAVPGLPEAGVGLVFRHHSLRPALRLGAVGDQAVISGAIGKQLYLEGAFAHALRQPRGFGWLGVGVRF